MPVALVLDAEVVNDVGDGLEGVGSGPAEFDVGNEDAVDGENFDALTLGPTLPKPLMLPLPGLTQ